MYELGAAATAPQEGGIASPLPGPPGEQNPWSYHGYGLGQGGPPNLDQSQAWWRDHCSLGGGICSVLDTPLAGGTCRGVRGTEEAKSLSPSSGTLCDGQGVNEPRGSPVTGRSPL